MTLQQPGILFSVEIFHSFFTTGICRSVEFCPGPSTRLLQKRFGFLLRNKNNGFEFYMSRATEAASFLKYIQDASSESYFDFTMETSDPAFYCYTSLPAGWKGQLIYDSNDSIAETGKDVVRLREKLSDNETNTAAGKVLIRFADIADTETGETGVKFVIQLEARLTQWQYFFVNDSAVVLNNPAISNSDGIEFDGPATVTIPTGQQALLFSSGKVLLPLQERSLYKFSLLNRGNPKEGDPQTIRRTKTIIKRLPYPDPVQFGLIKSGNGYQFSSPMYIFI